MHPRIARILPRRASLPLTLLAATLPAAPSTASATTETLHGVPVEVLSRNTVQTPDGSLTMVRLRQPVLPKPPAPPPQAAAPEPTAEELATQERRAAKDYRVLGLTAITYAGTPVITELSWTRQADGRRFVAYCAVPFEHLSQLRDIETSAAVYQYFPFVSEGDPALLAPGLREALAAAGTDADLPPAYLFVGDDADAAAESDTLEVIEHLLSHWHLHAPELIAQTAQRKAEAAERERQAALEAAKPKHRTLYFWKVESPEPPAAPSL